uniref:Uncharacterized protein n=1 Tax=Anopheles culicifacies TaxID=139723 RepID=A0A182MHI1_9DIPT
MKCSAQWKTTARLMLVIYCNSGAGSCKSSAHPYNDVALLEESVPQSQWPTMATTVASAIKIETMNYSSRTRNTKWVSVRMDDCRMRKDGPTYSCHGFEIVHRMDQGFLSGR